MRSIKFPNIFQNNATAVWQHQEYLKSTYQNTKTLFLSDRGQLLGDPYFGTLLRRYLFEPNGSKLPDFIIDTLYTQIALFIPQLRVKRDDIYVIRQPKKGKATIRVYGINQVDFQPNTYNIVVFKQSND